MYFKKINNKDNLLITIGDSWTEGVGCYDPDLLSKYHKGKIDRSTMYVESQNAGFFSRGSWATHLSEKLECDLINMGKGGAANSATAKYLIQDYHSAISEIAKKYKKVNVIWLMSVPERFSFYSNKELKSYRHDIPEKIAKVYYSQVLKDPLDSLLEASFHLRTVDWYCKANNYNFIYGSAFTPIPDFHNITNIEGSNIHQYVKVDCISQYLDHQDNMHWAPCGHPNNDGYIKIADHLFNIINYYFTKIL